MCIRDRSLTYVNYVSVVTALLLYKTIIQPLFYNFIPRINMTTKFLLSVLLFFVTIIALLGIELAAYHHQKNNYCVYDNKLNAANNVVYTVEYLWIIIPGVAYGFFVLLLILTGIEFICAQAPFNMKGLMVGITYVLFGLGCLIQTAISTPFLYRQPAWEKAPLTCGIWYFMLQGVIVIVGLVAAAVMIKKYKLRERSNSINNMIIM